MKYQVPQFIEVEDKIFGPLTVKQFLYVAGGISLAFIIWRTVPSKIIAVIIDIPLLVFFMALAFYKVNNKPFVFMLENAFKFVMSGKLYIWKKEQKVPMKDEIQKASDTETSQIYIPKLSDSKLKELTWGLDINEKLASRNDQEEN